LKIIPSTIYQDTGHTRKLINKGERIVFRLLEGIDFGNLHDIALHSLNMTNANWQRWSETDFIVISKLGLLVIEVKGGSVRCKNGIWEYSGKKTKNSPATQAKNAFYNLDQNYLQTNQEIKKITRNVPMGWCCIFPHIARIMPDEYSLPEQGDEITCYKEECINEQNFKGFLTRVYAHYISLMKEQGRKQIGSLDKEAISKIRKLLRPDFEQEISLDISLNQSKKMMQKLTEEQYEKIDFIQEFPRVMIEGGAGTGKTTLAVKALREEHARGKKTIFLSRSSIFNGFIKSNIKEEGIAAAHLGELEKYIEEEVKFDSCIMDEGQDLCDFKSLENIEKIIIGGLEEGRWRWFGDPNNQVAPSIDYSEDAYQYLKSFSYSSKLKYNVRNTPTIINKVQQWTLADMGSGEKYTGISDPPELSNSRTINDAYEDAQKRLQDWIKEGVKINDIALLAPNEKIIMKLRNLMIDLGLNFKVYNHQLENYSLGNFLVIATFDDFKGLDRDCVMVLGLDDHLSNKQEDDDALKKMLYVSMTRANYRLYISTTPLLGKKIAGFVEEYTTKGPKL
tara:strand:- start:2099 stop:3790 length:1692 start_codon:yes stop_codon:yes gene_type:complete